MSSVYMIGYRVTRHPAGRYTVTSPDGTTALDDAPRLLVVKLIEREAARKARQEIRWLLDQLEARSEH